jgi:hypothetical protein
MANRMRCERKAGTQVAAQVQHAALRLKIGMAIMEMADAKH